MFGDGLMSHHISKAGKDYLTFLNESDFLYLEGEMKGEMTLSDKKKLLEEHRANVATCTRCPLHVNRKNVVFGEGNPDADLVFVGEAPGEQEDIQGRPFVGAAGKLLTKIIKAMEMEREDVYICNVIKCRPPGNRDPLSEEIACCQGYLLKQLDIMKPKVICALGRHAAHTLLDVTTPIMQMRGNWYSFHGIPLLPTLHPASLLYTPRNKHLVWEDMKKIMKKLKREE